MSKVADTVKNKPVATTGTGAIIAAGVIGYAVYRGWIGADLGALLTPIVVAILATVAHELVAPWAKVQQVVENGLHISDADFGRFDAVLEQYGLQVIRKAIAVPDAPAIPAVDPAPVESPDTGPIPDGRSAGAPTDPAAG